MNRTPIEIMMAMPNFKALYDPLDWFSCNPLQEYIDGHTWVNRREITVRIPGRLLEAPMDPVVITVGAPFLHDFASIPWWARWYLPMTGQEGQPWGVPALCHDWLYEEQRIGDWFISRRTADQIFRVLMEYVRIPEKKTNIMYGAVRIGGGPCWRRHFRARTEG